MSAKILKGIVLSITDTKTVTVKVERAEYHKTYNKSYLSHKKYQVHYELEGIKVGDAVSITQCAPKSKSKHWIIKEIIK
jgi:small subunit ribosomal protein S17